LWRVTPPEQPEHKPGGGVTTKWVTILAFAGIGVDAAASSDWAARLRPDEARLAALHACLSEQGYPEWIEPLAKQHPAAVIPIVVGAFEAEWGSDGSQTPFLYQYGSNGITDRNVRDAVIETMAKSEPPRLIVLDYALSLLSRTQLEGPERAGWKQVALGRFRKYRKIDVPRAIRYVALLLITDQPSAVKTLLNWLNGTPPARRRRLGEQIVGLLFGTHDPIVPAPLKDASTDVLMRLLRLTYENVKPSDDNVREGSFTPDSRDEAENGRNALLKALLDRPGPESYDAVVRLSRSRAVQNLAVRFRELARGMAERDAEPLAWTVSEILTLERSYLLPIKSGEDLYRVVLGVLDEVAWDFDHADASSRAVLETARDEDSVQEWLHEQLRLRAKGRYHVHRESEVAEGNLPDIIASAIAAPFQVAIEAKHGDKGWTVSTLAGALKEQLAEDYLRPSNRRHGVFVVTRHRGKRWRDPNTGQLLDFSTLMETLAARAAKLKRNRVGPIAVQVRGIDAFQRRRRRGTRPSLKA
jgi:hypothetical protein